MRRRPDRTCKIQIAPYREQYVLEILISNAQQMSFRQAFPGGYEIYISRFRAVLEYGVLRELQFRERSKKETEGRHTSAFESGLSGHGEIYCGIGHKLLVN